MSRETRLLLTTALLAIVALWTLARVRFPDLPTSPNPVGPLLAPLADGAQDDGLAVEIGRLQGRLAPHLVAVNTSAAGAESAWPDASESREALRVGNDLVLLVLPEGQRLDPALSVAGRDPVSGLAVARVPGGVPSTPVAPWTSEFPQQPRYLAATDPSAAGVLLHPVFVGGFRRLDTPLWPDGVWSLPPSAGLRPGTMLFNGRADLAGIVIEHDGALAVVPGASALGAVAGLLERSGREDGHLGLDVQPLTPSLRAATGADAGLAVAWVQPAGPGAGDVAVGDVVEALNGQLVSTWAQWQAGAARLLAGDAVVLSLRRQGERRDVRLVAAAVPEPAAPSRREALGLAAQPEPGVGVRITGVMPGSAAARAGLVAGDVISMAAGHTAPTPKELTRLFAAAASGQPVLLAVTRGETHRLVALEK